MHLLEEEKYMKIREEENHKMKQELIRLKLEAQTLTHENRAKAEKTRNILMNSCMRNSV